MLPHFDYQEDEDVAIELRALLPEDVTLLGIDEEVAAVGGPYEWGVRGPGRV